MDYLLNRHVIPRRLCLPLSHSTSLFVCLSHHALLVLGIVPLVFLENDQTLEDGLVWEVLVGAQFGSLASSHAHRCLVRLELWWSAGRHEAG